MEIVWRNLKVEEFNKICRLCLANKQLLEPLAQEEKNTMIKLTPWIAQLETSAFFPNKICAECSKQLHQVNEFLNRCNTLSNSFHRCIEEYKVSAKNDSKIPSLETLFTTKVPIKQEVEEIEDDSEEEPCPTMPFTEVFMDEIKKETDEVMEFEDTKFIPQQTTSNSAESSSKFDNGESVEVTPDIPVLERGFEPGDNRNLPDVSAYIIHDFYCYCYEESLVTSNKAAFWMEQYTGFHSDETVGWIQVKKKVNKDSAYIYTVKAVISKSKNMLEDVGVTLVIDEDNGTVLESDCRISTHIKGACSHSIVLLFFLYRLTNFPPRDTSRNYWCPSHLSILGKDVKPMTLQEMYPASPRVEPTNTTNFLSEVKKAMANDEYFSRKLIVFNEIKSISLYNLMLNYKEMNAKGVDCEGFLKYCKGAISDATSTVIRENATVNPKDEAYYECIYARITDSNIFKCFNNPDNCLLDTIFCETKLPTSDKTDKQKLKDIVLEIVETTMQFKSVTKGVIIRKEHPFFAVCPDAVSDTMCLSIKIATKEKPKETYLTPTGALNEKYYAKIQLQMYIANKQTCIFCIAAENIGETKMVDAYRVEFDRNKCVQLIKDAEQFWKTYVFPKLALM